MLKINVLILITSHVHACQNHFFEAVSNNILDVFVNLVGWTARGSSANVWNDAVRAEIVASIVNLDQASGVESAVSWPVAEQILVKTFGVNGFAFHAAVDDAEKRVFPLVVDGVVDNTAVEHLLFPMVHHASHRRDYGSRVGTSDLVDCLPTFLVALVGYGAGVYNVDVSVVVVFHDVVACLFELRRQSVRFIEIYTATECFKGYFHSSSPSIDNAVALVTLTVTICPIRLLSLDWNRMTIFPSVWPVR